MSPRVSVRLLSAQSDARLLALVARGHERAFEALVLRYRKPLLAYCGRLGLADARAEDVLQQALLKAWLSLAAGTEVRELRPWLYRIVHNTAVNAIRASAADGEAPHERVLALAPAPDAELERTLAARQTLSDVAALPTMQRDAILLSAVEGRSHEEVASALGVTSTAARGLIYRARAALRSAAAALTPPWLVQWASGAASRVTPSAARLADVYAGAGDSGSGLLKGATLAVTAALAAGAAIGPLAHTRHPAVHRPAALAHHSAPRGGAQSVASVSAADLVASAPRKHAGSPGAGGVSRTGAAPLQRATAHAYSHSPQAPHRVYTAPAGGSGQQQSSGGPSTGTGSGTPTGTATTASSTPPSSGSGAPAPSVEPPAEAKPSEKPAEKAPEKPAYEEPKQPGVDDREPGAKETPEPLDH